MSGLMADKSVVEIGLAKDFSVFPGGRYATDGPFPGEDFRNMLIPLFQNHDEVVVDLDGVRGHPSSFMEEVFGGLLRHGLTHDEVVAKLRVKSKSQKLCDEAWSYVYEEADRQHN